MELIDKSDVVAEIKRRIAFFSDMNNKQVIDSNLDCAIAFAGLRDFIDTLEVKEETEWNEASIKPPFVETMDGNKYSEPVLCRDKFGGYFIAKYVRWKTGYYGWFSGDDEISITHWKELQ